MVVGKNIVLNFSLEYKILMVYNCFLVILIVLMILLNSILYIKGNIISLFGILLEYIVWLYFFIGI